MGNDRVELVSLVRDLLYKDNSMCSSRVKLKYMGFYTCNNCKIKRLCELINKE